MDDVTDEAIQESFEFDTDTMESEPIANDPQWTYDDYGQSLEEKEHYRQEAIRGRRERLLGLASTKFEGHETESILKAARAFEEFVLNG